MRKRPLWHWLDEAADLLAGGANHHLAERILDAATVTEQLAKQEQQTTRLISETRGFITAIGEAEAHATIRFDAIIDLLIDTRNQLEQFNEQAKELNRGC